MGVVRKWHFSTSGGAANLGGVSGDLSEHRGSGIPLLGITSLNRHFNAQIDWTIGGPTPFFPKTHRNQDLGMGKDGVGRPPPHT